MQTGLTRWTTIMMMLNLGACYPDKPSKNLERPAAGQIKPEVTPDSSKYYLVTQDMLSAQPLAYARARRRLKERLAEPKKERILIQPVIRNAETAVAIAEALAFDAFGGPSEIVPERPYSVMLLDGYWIVNGTLPESYIGGTFEVTLDAKDGRVVCLWHGE
ncbi:hypothetical protein GCM10028821_34210 [Hymenobacter jeollabukensis]